MNQTPVKPSHDEVQLATWPCAQQTDQQQRHGRYLPGSDEHPATILAELARRAIDAYSRPGDLVLDPTCGTGTTLVEAIHLGRRAIGVEPDGRQATLARANLQNTNTRGVARGQAICGDPDDLIRLLAHRAKHLLRSPMSSSAATLPYGRIDLLLTGSATTGPEAAERRYGVWARLLRPGGFLVVVIGHDAGYRLSEALDQCEAIGLRYWRHVTALRAARRDNEPVLEQSTICSDAASSCHQDALVFRKQQSGPNPPAGYQCCLDKQAVVVEAIEPSLESESA
jgi:SAM-dependent methyltransferase